ncbi:MAG: formylglycine-generating enzyme family protein, partial [Bacteroidales bacterium]|nr:formylglycine-generating enzyme family protein [Bacteroidales bacterium]
WRLADLDDECDENLYYSKAKDILMKNDLELNFLNDEEKTFFVKVFYDCCINGVDTNYVKLEDKLLTLYQQIQSVADGVPDDTAPLYYKEIMANTYCRITDSTVALVEQQDMYDKAIVLFEEVTNAYDLNDYSKKNLANAYYRSSFLRKNRFVGDVYFQKADSIWSSLPPETEGELKGFVKTSYGIYDPEFGFKLVKVEKGCFDMGLSNEEMNKCRSEGYQFDNDELPCHNVTIDKDYYIGMFPVTKGQWNKCRERIKIPSYEEMKNDGIKTEENINDNKFKFRVGGEEDDCPMNYVSADDADKFILQMNQVGKKYSLPTETQWEFAARGGANNSVRHIFSGNNSWIEVADCAKQYKLEGNVVSFPGPNAVGSRKANELGIYDMSGCVGEWCLDWYHPQSYSADYHIYWNDHFPESMAKPIDLPYKEYYLNDIKQSLNSNQRCRVLRGGFWYYDPQYCRVSSRNRDYPFDRSSCNGFRLAFVP